MRHGLACANFCINTHRTIRYFKSFILLFWVRKVALKEFEQ